MDNQPVFNKYKAVTFMCSSFSKIEDQCKQAMKEAIEKAFKNKLHQAKTKQTSWIFLSKHECFIQEGNHHILQELKLRKVFPAVHLANVGVVDLYQGVSGGTRGAYYVIVVRFFYFFTFFTCIFCLALYPLSRFVGD